MAEYTNGKIIFPTAALDAPSCMGTSTLRAQLAAVSNDDYYGCFEMFENGDTSVLAGSWRYGYHDEAMKVLQRFHVPYNAQWEECLDARPGLKWYRPSGNGSPERTGQCYLTLDGEIYITASEALKLAELPGDAFKDTILDRVINSVPPLVTAVWGKA